MRSSKIKLIRAIAALVVAVLAIGTPDLFSPATDYGADMSVRQELPRSSGFDPAPEAIDIAQLLELPQSEFSAPDIASLLKTASREDFFAVNADQKGATYEPKGGNVQ